MRRLLDLPRAIRFALVGLAGGAVALGAYRYWSRRSRWEQRAFVMEYQAVLQGLISLDRVRPAWQRRLDAVQSRHGDEHQHTLILRCRVMAFDELAGDVDAAAEQIDAISPHLAKLAEEDRWLFVAGLQWLAWRLRRQPSQDRCRSAFEAIVDVDRMSLAERVSLGFRLAQAAAQAGHLLEARWILDRADKMVSSKTETPSDSPYRGGLSTGTAAWSDAELGFEVRCERIRVEANACDLTAARAALTELDAWVDARPHAPKIVHARRDYWHGLVRHVSGDYGLAAELFADADKQLAALDDEVPDIAVHRELNLLAWVDTLLDLQRPDEAATIGRRAVDAAVRPAERAQASAVLAMALVQLGQDEEAAALLAEPASRAEPPALVAPTLALLAMRRGALDEAVRYARRSLAQVDRSSPFAAETLLTVARVLAACRRPSLGQRVARFAAAQVIGRLGPQHPQLAKLYRFLAERARADGHGKAAASLDEAADRLHHAAARA